MVLRPCSFTCPVYADVQRGRLVAKVLPSEPGDFYRGGLVAGMNIKNAEAQALAKELADLTGETMTEAVIVALRERLAEVRSREEHVRARTEAIMAIGRE